MSCRLGVNQGRYNRRCPNTFSLAFLLPHMQCNIWCQNLPEPLCFWDRPNYWKERVISNGVHSNHCANWRLLYLILFCACYFNIILIVKMIDLSKSCSVLYISLNISPLGTLVHRLLLWFLIGLLPRLGSYIVQTQNSDAHWFADCSMLLSLVHNLNDPITPPLRDN